MQSLRSFGLILLTWLLISCGGGGEGVSVTNTGNVGGTPTPTPTPDPVYSVVIELLNNSGQADPATIVSRDAPGFVRATVSKDGVAMAFELVTFTTSSVGVLDPISGTARTDAGGVASISLLPGTVAGAGIATASITTEGGTTVTASIAIASAGDANTTPTGSGFNVSILLKNSVTLAQTTTVSAAAPGRVEAIVTNPNGTPVINNVVTFTTTLGTFTPAVGTALTDSNGLAAIIVNAGSVLGAGEITATINSSSASIGFNSLGDEGGGTAPAYSIQLTLLNSNGDVDPSGLISQATPGSLRATLSLDNNPVAFALVTFSTEITGVLNPSLGTAQTNTDGMASVTLLPGTGQGTGIANVAFTTPDNIVISDTLTFNSAGDAPTNTGSTDVKMTIGLKDANTGASSTVISANAPGRIDINLTSFDGVPLANKVIIFASTLGEFRPSLGTALTDQNGFASIILTAGSVEGAGEITASFEGNSVNTGFYSQGDVVDPNSITADVEFKILSCPPGWDRTLRDVNLCTRTQNISSTAPGILYIKALKKGSTVPLTSTLVSATSTLGRISPDTGTAITDENGIALLDLLAGSDVGAGEVEVSVISTQAKTAFEIGAAEVTMTLSSGLAAGQSLSAGATTVISVNIFDIGGELFIPPLNVEFTSNCAVSTPPKAVLDQNVTSVGGVATATYRADGCAPEDTVTVTVITGGDAITDTIVIPVNEASIGSIEFIDAVPTLIGLASTGGQGRAETSIVQFKVLDENGNPASQKDVTFELTNVNGGISISPSQAQSNNDGLVQTVVRSGNVHGAVRVLAYITPTNNDPGNNDNRISSVSDLITISTGLPDNNSFTLSANVLNPEGLNHTGVIDVVTVHMADRFNNPVPDGTAVVLTTEGGAIGSGCTTTNGVCTVDWRSQNPIPFSDASYENTIVKVIPNKENQGCDPYFGSPAPCSLGIHNAQADRKRPLGGRATVLAHAVGEESFTDLNGNGVFDPWEYFSGYDLPEAFIDHNENGSFDGLTCEDPSDPCDPAISTGGEFEEFVDFNSNGVYDGPDGKYNGLLCTEAAQTAGTCNWELVNVRDSLVLTMSGSDAFLRAVTGTNVNTCDPYERTDVSGNHRILIQLEDSDIGTSCDVSFVDLSSYFDVNGNDIGVSSIPITFIFSDIYNNPLPAGTTISITSDNGTLAGGGTTVMGSTNSPVPRQLSILLTREGEGNKKTSGAIEVVFTTPLGTITTYTLAVQDDK